MRLRTTLMLILALALLPTLAVAQEDSPGPITWLAYSKVVSGKTGDAVKLTLEDQAFYDGLVADGTILSWGLLTPVNHSPGDLWNHAQWVSVESWAKIGAWVAAFGQYNAGLSEEQQADRQKRFEEIYVAGSHYDEVVRHGVFKINPSPEARPRWFHVGTFNVKPGKEGAFVDLFKQWGVPVVDQLLADGAISGYGVYSASLHGDHGWTHRIWQALPGLGGVDAVQAAFAAAASPEAMAKFEEVLGPGHSDQVLMVLHINDPAGPAPAADP